MKNEDDMVLTIFIGNGFDINLGLNTSYCDFYHVFLANNSTSYNIFEKNSDNIHPELVSMIKENEGKKDWADLEMLLGQSIGKFDSIDRLEEEKAYLEEQLNNYLKLEQERFSIINARELKRRMDVTINKLLDLFGWNDQVLFLHDDKTITVQFLTFNYTDILDRIVDEINSVFGMGSENGLIIRYNKPLHIHGEIDVSLVLGVDNNKQYGNYTSIIKNSTIKDESINSDNLSKFESGIEELNRIMLKPNLNYEVREKEFNRINEAMRFFDKVLIFGCSLGETDIYWWKRIAERLTESVVKANQKHEISKCRLGICWYYPNMNSVSATSQSRIVEPKNIFKRLITDEFKDSVRNDVLNEICTNYIDSHKCKDWMFNFKKNNNSCAECFKIGERRIYPSLN